MSEAFLYKLIIVLVASFFGFLLGLMASMFIDNGEWENMSMRMRWGNRLVGIGIALVTSFGFFATNDVVSDRSVFTLLALVGTLSLAGAQGRNFLIKNYRNDKDE